MKKNEANIEITRQKGVLSSISISMPIWHKIEDSCKHITIDIPLFGIKTVAEDENDIDKAVDESIKCFCASAEKFGQGLEAELKTLGWKSNDTNNSLLDFNSDSDVVEQIMDTGDNYVHADLELEMETV